MKLIPFNLNDYILVKLTDKGFQHLADNHNKRFRKIDRDGDFYKNQADSNGYTRIQVWDFIEQFANRADHGIHNYFDFNILIEIKHN